MTEPVHAAMPEESAISESRVGWSRLRRGGIWLLISGVLMIPKLMALRRRRAAWNVLRMIAAFAGTALIIWEALGPAHSLQLAAGFLFLLFALAVSPERTRISMDEHAREMGALVVVDGGQFRATDGSLHKTSILVGNERIWAVGPALQPLLEIPFSQIREIGIDPANRICKLRLTSRNLDAPPAEFLYSGPFAEHLAHVAETTLRNQLHKELPVLH